MKAERIRKKENTNERNICKNWFWLCLALCGVILVMLAMFFNYNLKLSAKQVKLEKENSEEKKNIADLQKEIEELKKKLGN